MKLAKDFRREALDALRGNWGKAVAAVLILMIPVIVYYVMVLLGAQLGGDDESFVTSICMLIGYAVLFLLYMPLLYGFKNATLEQLKGADTSLPTLTLNTFTKEYGRGLWVNVLLGVLSGLMTIGLIAVAVILFYVLFGMMGSDFFRSLNTNLAVMAAFIACVYIFIIPALIWLYAVSQTYYIAHEHPELSVREAMKASKQLMAGRKWRLLCLQCSFLGWAFLCNFTLGIGILWLLPYQTMAESAFYREALAESQTDANPECKA